MYFAVAELSASDFAVMATELRICIKLANKQTQALSLLKRKHASSKAR
jgi:hypothetical protein